MEIDGWHKDTILVVRSIAIHNMDMVLHDTIKKRDVSLRETRARLRGRAGSAAGVPKENVTVLEMGGEGSALRVIRCRRLYRKI